MARTLQLSDLRSLTRARFEIDDNYVSDSDLNEWINQAYLDYYDALLDASPDHFLSSADSTVVNGTATYAVPATMYRLRGVDLLDSDGVWRAMDRFPWAERNVFEDAQLIADRIFTRYALAGSNIYLHPTPSWGQANGLRMWYIPEATTMSMDTDTVTVTQGSEEFILLGVGIRFYTKMEWDPSALMALRAETKKRVYDMAATRDVGEAKQVANLERRGRWRWNRRRF